ncbi:diacylglycerol kinase [Paenibacillus cisolokensis]|jgi:diacylglycerol kinase|uniref:Diacylglycerol kinase n=1 Tax=Paenibacillus cisolokensis TaxID=1658519 RepID=A0ABQ4NBJ9_9BACL|nr:diacylglycerol kinase [Paenibacillus cisolokensis]GIQ65343.1 diacylglycerol kinase [Paenibacillus cisolokensis]
MRRFLRSFRFAVSGVAYTVRTQRNMRIHLAFAVAVIVAATALGVSALEGAVLALAAASVMALELVNTAVERTIDRIGPDPHPLAKTAKDAAAGAVLVAAAGAALAGLFILGPPLWRLLFGG